MMETVTVDPAEITQTMVDILRAGGCAEDEARCVAEHLTDASATGHDSHGIIRILRYHQWLQTGQIRAGQGLTPMVELDAFTLFDGNSGMGQRLARDAVARGIAMAKDRGFAGIGLRRAGHIGRLGAYTEQAAAEGLVSIMFVNVAGSQLVAPFGTGQRAASTAPVSVGVPNPGGDDFILDFATSMVAEGKALVAAQGGAPLKVDALVDSDGRPTRDPAVLYGESVSSAVPDPRGGDGALQAFGLHKGSGLMLACELLAGALTSNGTNGATEHPFGNGLLAVFIDPARLDAEGAIFPEVAGYIDFVRGLTPGTDTDRVLIPGDRERTLRAKRMREGIPLPKRVAEEIEALARNELG
ncbi:Ldh family oxidoreductase [Marivita hallyeonensis]|uniref:Uncharacterized oxidoreductase n=1 Tax=Marivita hallyeonensis TaxID=996342 RepID=A0A1M5Y0M5_9RHOB|nr:Ldh family oxidoreductase [Marivita hallyeonensis]SHI05607.1 uncharacterized oxidoreductase [Marivita hallyeonensis]